MGDVGETFKELREQQREKKLSNKNFSTDLLTERGIEFESKNGGVHLIVKTPAGKVDFWPSTGQFICRSSHREARGVRKLLAHIDNLSD